MKKTLFILILVFVVSLAFAGDFKWMQMNLYQATNVANSFGDTYNFTYFEVEGGGNAGPMSLYFFLDVEDVFGIVDEVQEWKNPGSFFVKINPRLSIPRLMKKEMKMGPITDWYLATQYKGWNGGDNYYVGLGTDWAFWKGFGGLNFYKMMQQTKTGNDTDGYEREFEDAGYVIALNWFFNLYEFNKDFNLSYQGWSDFGFSNSFAEDNGGVATEFQMFNGFFWNYKKHWAVSTNVKLHNNFIYHDTENHNATSFFFGLHYKM